MPEMSISYHGREKPLEPGIYTIPEFDLSLLNQPIRTRNTQYSTTLTTLQTNQDIGWPVVIKLGDTYQDAASWHFSDGRLTISPPHWFGSRSSMRMPIIQSVIEVQTHPTIPDETILTWTVANTKFIKIASNFGVSTLPVDLYSSVCQRYATSSSVGRHDLAQLLVSRGYERDFAESLADPLAAILGGPKGERNTRYFTTPVTLTGHPTETIPLEEKPYHQEIVPALIAEPAVLPLMSHYSDNAAILDRLYSINPGKVTIPEDVKTYAGEFKKRFTDHMKMALVVPLSEEEVVARQKTSITTRRMLEASQQLNREQRPLVKAFVKKEAYSEPKDMRNISAVCPEHNLEGFRYSLPIKDSLLYHQHWYCPGKTPTQLVESMVAMCTHTLPLGYQSDGFIEGDFSRYDGRQTESVRRLVFGLTRSCYHKDHRRGYDAMIDRHFKTICKLPSGVKYRHLGSMLSGAWCTTDANTILNALICYIATRRLGLSTADAYASLGRTFGDDSVMLEIVRHDGVRLSTLLEGVALDLGLKLDIVPRREYFSFLSRFYRVDNGRVLATCPDLARIMPKFHLAIQNEATPEYAITKFSAYYQLCGENTPILSAYLRKWFALNDYTPIRKFDLLPQGLPYWCYLQESAGLQFPECDHVLSHLVLVEASTALGSDPINFLNFEAHINKSASLSMLSEFCLDRNPPVPNPRFLVFGNDVAVTGPLRPLEIAKKSEDRASEKSRKADPPRGHGEKRTSRNRAQRVAAKPDRGQPAKDLSDKDPSNSDGALVGALHSVDADYQQQ